MAKFIGIDTSCYTTSAAIYDEEQGLIAEERTVLKVKAGHRGLSQSEMIYQHVRNLPELFKKPGFECNDIAGIGVSAFPRRRADSYMPAFLVGRGTADILGASLHVPVYYFSHQENHAMAAMRHAPELWGKPFYMIHMSGGTQDVLSVTWKDGEMQMDEWMTSMDITAGQFIDRVGVALGLPFPAGKHLEKLAQSGDDSYKVQPARVRRAFSFSGVETKVQRDIQSGKYAPQNIARGVLSSIGMALKREMLACPFEAGRTLIAVGGVMSNLYIRRVMEEICRKKQMNLLLAEPSYSSDNATGNAFGAYMRFSHEDIHSR